MNEDTKATRAYRVIYDSIGDAENAWDLYHDIDSNSPVEGWKAFNAALADSIYSALTEYKLATITKEDRLRDELMDLEEKKTYLLEQVNFAIEKIDAIRSEIGRYSIIEKQ